MKRKSIISILIVFILLAVAMIIPRNVFASTEYPEQPTNANLGSVVSVGTNGLNDTMLYYKLTEVYNTYYGLGVGSRIDELRQYMFKGMDFSVFDGVLDLGGGGVNTLEGLELIDFSQCINLTTLKLDNNNLVTITAKSTSTLSCIVNLDISGNSLSSVDLTSFVNLRILDASSNDLTNVNLTFLKTEVGEAYINLIDNPIEDAEDVTFRREGLLDNKVNLYILNTLEDNKYEGNAKVIVHAGLTGVQSKGKYTPSDKLMFYKIDNLAGLNINVSDILVNIVDYDNPNISVINAISNVGLEDNVNILSQLSYGKYMLYFTDALGNSISANCSALVDKYNGYTIEYIPCAPTIVVNYGDDVIDFKSGNVLTKDATISFSATDANSKFLYKLGYNGEWVEANSVDLKSNNIQTLYIKNIINGVESDITTINFGKDTTFGMEEITTIALVAIALLVLFFVLIPVVRYFIHKPLTVGVKEKKKKDE